MKLLNSLLIISAAVAISGCKTVQNPLQSQNGKTYAEISSKTDGTWNGKKYVGGTVFRNTEVLTLDPRHTDHSFDIRYEGPGWESNKIGYRLYLDWRNAIDIFGKKTESIVLPKVGQDNFDSYHKITAWGGDVLHNGKALGIGGIGRYVAGNVLHFNDVASTVAKVANYKDRSEVKIDYKRSTLTLILE